MVLVTTATCQISYNNQIWINIINHLFKYVSIKSNLYATHREAAGVIKNRGLFRWKDQITAWKEEQRKKGYRSNFPSYYLHTHAIHNAAELHIYFCRVSELLKIVLLSKMNFSKLSSIQQSQAVLKTYLADSKYILTSKLNIILGKNPGTYL